MSKKNMKYLANAFINFHINYDKLNSLPNAEKLWIAMDDIFDIAVNNPENLWELIIDIIRMDPPNTVQEILAAGLLEDYLVKCGSNNIDKIKEQSESDKMFSHLLGGVWKNKMSDELWNTVQECADKTKWG